MRPRLKPSKPQSTQGALAELVLIVALAVGLALGIQAFIVKPYQIPSGSMEPTLDIGQRVLVNRFLYHFTDPGVGDIVVFNPPKGAEAAGPKCGVARPQDSPCAEATPDKGDVNFIKRIVAGPGDTIAVKNGHPVINGVEKTDEPFINDCNEAGGGAGCNLPVAITIPDDHYFMMGDNRGQSDDSRFWGPVPKDWIIGKAFATYWPPKRIGIF
jgi:signal peptidase I